MSIIIEESEEIPCYSCVQMRKIFLLVAVSSLLPMILFMALLLLLSARKSQLEDSTSTIVEFVFGLLYLHLFVATFMMLGSYLKRRSPVRYQCFYLLFHAVCMLLFFISSLLLTIINQSYALAMCLVVLCALYVCFLCYFLKINNIALFAISRAF